MHDTHSTPTETPVSLETVQSHWKGWVWFTGLIKYGIVVSVIIVLIAMFFMLR